MVNPTWVTRVQVSLKKHSNCQAGTNDSKGRLYLTKPQKNLITEWRNKQAMKLM